MSTSLQPLSEARIAAYLRGELDERERAQVEAAMDADPQWLGVLAALAGDQDHADAPSETMGSTVARLDREHRNRLHPGQRVGRFDVESQLGRGGMGSVYAANDTKLRRTIALKVLHASRPSDQPRLIAEARALAQVNDPHVITVHDVGRWNDRVFVAMELLRGENLREWRAAAARSWREVVDVYLDAGGGLSAAHAAGIVHRDVKPSNVMRTDDGRVVVLDFGLAVELALGPDTPDADRTSEAGTRRAGTPAYMAPEQRRGERATPASDQFSLSVALHESLLGALPEASAQPERDAGFDACKSVPRRVLRVVQRGLSLRAGERYPSMNAFVDALRSASNTPLWPTALVGFSCLGLGLLVWPAREDASSCSGAEDELAQVWTQPRRANVDRALRSPSAAWSDAVADSVDTRIDGYADAWLTEHRNTCEAAREDDAVLGARMLCLDRRLAKLDALVTVLENADREVVGNAIQAVDALPPVERCREVTSLDDADGTSDPEAEQLRKRLAEADILREAASFEDAAQVTRDALGAIVARRDESLEARARMVLGAVRSDLGQPDDAEEQLRIALALATMSRNDRVAGESLDRLAWVVGYQLGRHRDGRALADRAEAWSVRLEGPDHFAAFREITRGTIEREAANHDLALEHFERAMAIARASDAPDASYDLGLAFNGAGTAHLSAGRLEQALEAFDASGQLLAERLGAQHPKHAHILNNRGGVLRALGRPEDALAVFERTLGIFEAAYGSEHLASAQTMANMAVVLSDLQRYPEAEHRADAAIRVFTTVAGENHPLVAKCYALRGDARLGREDYESGLEDLHRAMSMEIELLGPDHPSLGISQSNLSIVYDKLGRLEEAVTHQERALEILVAAHGESHDLVGIGRMNLAFLERKRGDYERSLELYEQAAAAIVGGSRHVALLGTGEAYLLVGRVDDAVSTFEEAETFIRDQPASAGSRGEGLFLLAQARWQQGHRSDALQLAEKAVTVLEDEEEAALAAEARDWLRAPAPFACETEG